MTPLIVLSDKSKNARLVFIPASPICFHDKWWGFGSVPVKQFADSNMYTSELLFNNELGKVPWRALLDSDKYVRFVGRSDGMLPVKLFDERSKCVSEENAVLNPVGIVPVSPLLETSRYARLFGNALLDNENHEPKAPDKLFDDRSKKPRAESLSIEDGTTPLILFPDSFSV
jgi:hypothetical protein